jgi:hypothetical protein
VTITSDAFLQALLNLVLENPGFHCKEPSSSDTISSTPIEIPLKAATLNKAETSISTPRIPSP